MVEEGGDAQDLRAAAEVQEVLAEHFEREGQPEIAARQRARAAMYRAHAVLADRQDAAAAPLETADKYRFAASVQEMIARQMVRKGEPDDSVERHLVIANALRLQALAAAGGR